MTYKKLFIFILVFIIHFTCIAVFCEDADGDESTEGSIKTLNNIIIDSEKREIRIRKTNQSRKND